MSTEHDPALTYASYLAVDELLQLQRPLSDGPEHDELLFIVIHQTYELWFKQLLHELTEAQATLEAGDTYRSMAILSRAFDSQSLCFTGRHSGDDDAVAIQFFPRPALIIFWIPIGTIPRSRSDSRSP